MRLLLATIILIAIQDIVAAASYHCTVMPGATSLYQKDGRWEHRLERSDPASASQELRVTLSDDGSHAATVEHVRFNHTAKAQWSEHTNVIMVVEPHELGGISILSIFRDAAGKRPASYARQAAIGYAGAAALFSGFCEQR